jgi:hypothetical protein
LYSSIIVGLWTCCCKTLPLSWVNKRGDVYTLMSISRIAAGRTSQMTGVQVIWLDSSQRWKCQSSVEWLTRSCIYADWH